LFVRGLNGFVWGWLITSCKKRSLRASERAGYLAPYDSYENRIAVLRFVQDIPLHQDDLSFDCLAGVSEALNLLRDKPMLILWGGKDFVFDHHVLSEWIRRFTAAQVEVFPEAGHLILEDARDESLALIRDFLKADRA
jgi:haloalkane dehalogenase